MSEAQTEQVDSREEARKRGHEPDRLRVRALVWLVIGFVAFAVASHAGLWFLLKGYTDEPRAADERRSVARAEAAPAAGAPPLQPIPGHDEVPWQDLARVRAKEDDVFAAMGWTVARGHARIPDAVIRAVASGRTTTAPTSRPAAPGGAK